MRARSMSDNCSRVALSFSLTARYFLIGSKSRTRGSTVKLKLCSAAGAVLLLSACATNADWLVTKASRADGVVALSYERNEFQRPDMSEQQAVQLAEQKCKNWGYKGAEPFGSQSTECLSRRGFGNCGSRRVTVEFQCTGSPGQ